MIFTPARDVRQINLGYEEMAVHEFVRGFQARYVYDGVELAILQKGS